MIGFLWLAVLGAGQCRLVNNLTALGWDLRLINGSLSGGGIYHGSDLGNAVGRESTFFGVFLNSRFIRCDVDAIDFVVGHIAFYPLDFWPHVAKDAA
jgi:hypothetical protein